MSSSIEGHAAVFVPRKNVKCLLLILYASATVKLILDSNLLRA